MADCDGIVESFEDLLLGSKGLLPQTKPMNLNLMPYIAVELGLYRGAAGSKSFHWVILNI
ncbi:hypothetical protein FRX31_011051 [Thalictrum thalictroides]|uniref:Uncharacterized protein n=1 Tax=Thalictrum thalictroides TaxID=46969 RepID=A0A7J6WQY7_THATH|nr:hypothetical protein FRX31_011051 [Thalictrum thalictroides]